MRRLGVYGDNLPTKRERSVQAADFSIAGIIGFFGRQFEKPFSVKSALEAKTIFGEQFDSATYGWDAVRGFFENLSGEAGSLYILSPKGTAATQAATTAIHADVSIKSAYAGNDAFGAWSNNIGVKITRVNGFQSKLAAESSSSSVVMESVAGYKVGDQVIHNTVPTTVYTITAINADTKTLVLSAGLTGATGDTLAVAGYNLRVFNRSATGEVVEVEQSLGKTLVTLNQNDRSKFISDVFANSTQIKVDVTAGITTVIADSTHIVYLTGGTDGTLPTTDYTGYFPAFDGIPIRMAAIPETTAMPVHQSFEAYCKNREDNPIVFYVGQAGITAKETLIQTGNAVQRMDEVDGVYVHNWVKISDPFSNSGTATRIVPNCGHLMGAWIRSIARNGIHSSPARRNIPLMGIIEPVGFTADNDFDRTELAEAGVNVIQQARGIGIMLRNLFSLSTSPEFKFANAIIQRNFIKISCVTALQISENTPNNIESVLNDRVTVINFMHKLWKQGSNGNTKEGETFGQYMRDDGSLSTEADGYEVIADASNNPVSQLQIGNRNIDVYFMFPAPAGSIKIGVGIIYKA
ncbi:MAG: hypothetical protein LBP19_05310 [Treponema sp.]|jgi:hypothetical protein|nr:hypothetical protein [Treponema sp.]